MPFCVGRDLRVVGQMRDLARGIDRALAVDPHAVAGAIGDAAADDEVERRRAPHAIGNAHLRQAREVEARRLDAARRAAGAPSPARPAAWRRIRASAPSREVIGLTPIPNQRAERRCLDAPAFGRLADRPGRDRLALARRKLDRAGAIVDRDPVAFLERPAARLLRRQVDAASARRAWSESRLRRHRCLRACCRRARRRRAGAGGC